MASIFGLRLCCIDISMLSICFVLRKPGPFPDLKDGHISTSGTQNANFIALSSSSPNLKDEEKKMHFDFHFLAF